MGRTGDLEAHLQRVAALFATEPAHEPDAEWEDFAQRATDGSATRAEVEAQTARRQSREDAKQTAFNARYNEQLAALRRRCDRQAPRDLVAPVAQLTRVRPSSRTRREPSGPARRRAGPSSDDPGPSSEGDGEPHPPPALLFLVHEKYGRINRALARFIDRTTRP